MPRTSRCGQVIGPSDKTASARSSTAASRPSAPPIAKASSATPAVAPSGDADRRERGSTTPCRARRARREGRGRQRPEQQLAFACLQRGGGKPPPFLELDDRRRRDDPAGVKMPAAPSAGRCAACRWREGESGSAGPGLLANRFAVGQKLAPHLFEIVVGADFRPEQVHDDIARIDQHPVALRLALDRDAGAARRAPLRDARSRPAPAGSSGRSRSPSGRRSSSCRRGRS